METRNRSEGWKFAKLSGHKNEDNVKELLLNNTTYRNDFLKRIHKENSIIKRIQVGGLNEKNVECILNSETTKPKTDLYIDFDDNTYLNFSIKKSERRTSVFNRNREIYLWI